MGTQAVRVLAVVVSLAAAVAAASCNQAEPPAMESYGDCILQHVESGMDANAVSMIRSACRSKFPLDADEPVDAAAEALDAGALSRVTFRRTGGSSSSLFGVLYNGNSDVTLTEVDIAISTMFDGAEESHTYRARQAVPPYGTTTVQLSILPGDRAAAERASIAAARGRPAQ